MVQRGYSIDYLLKASGASLDPNMNLNSHVKGPYVNLSEVEAGKDKIRNSEEHDRHDSLGGGKDAPLL